MRWRYRFLYFHLFIYSAGFWRLTMYRQKKKESPCFMCPTAVGRRWYICGGLLPFWTVVPSSIWQICFCCRSVYGILRLRRLFWSASWPTLLWQPVKSMSVFPCCQTVWLHWKKRGCVFRKRMWILRWSRLFSIRYNPCIPDVQCWFIRMNTKR